jgi:hypothetical protein
MNGTKEERQNRMRSINIMSCVIAIVGLLDASARATVVLDQAVEPSITDPSDIALFNQGSSFAQTFTVGVAGTLDHIDVLTRVSNTSSGNLDFDIRPTVGGVPVTSDSLVLASGQVSSSLFPVYPPSNTWAWITLDVSSAHVNVIPGEVLTISLTPELLQGAYEWAGTSGDVYAGGSSFERVSAGQPFVVFPPTYLGVDNGFRTYVNTPEPATFVLAAIGVCALVVHRRRIARIRVP